MNMLGNFDYCYPLSLPTFTEGNFFFSVTFRCGKLIRYVTFLFLSGKGLFHLIHGCRRKRDPDYEVLEPILGEEDHIAE